MNQQKKDVAKVDPDAKKAELDRIRKHLWPNLNDSQFQIAIRRLNNLRNRGIEIDPFDQFITPVVYKKGKPGEKLIFIYNREFHLTVLRHVPGYEGHRAHVIHKNDHYIMSGDKDIPDHQWSQNDRGEIIGAWSVIYIKDIKRPFFKEIKFSEYEKTPRPEEGETNFLWKKGPTFMIEKCALVANAREVDVSMFGLSYVEGELPVKDGLLIDIPVESAYNQAPPLKEKKQAVIGTPVTELEKSDFFQLLKKRFPGDEEIEQFLMAMTNNRIATVSEIASKEELTGLQIALEQEKGKK
jgi:hypothetical protein